MDLQVSLDRWSALALEQDWLSDWVEGAIFPCEMVFFLASCEARGVTSIIESGRQDGFSTRILGEFAKLTGATVISVDLEEDAPRSERCRIRLEPFPLRLIKGNAFVEVPRAVYGAKGTIALIIDGPKGWPALAMAYACASLPKVALVSLHNLIEGSGWRDQFVRLSAGKAFYEDHAQPGPQHWQELRSREAKQLTHGVRSLEASSLGVMDLARADRAAVAGMTDARFRFNQPAALRLGWSLGQFELTRYAFSLSARLFRD